jgi:hypothetical protein
METSTDPLRKRGKKSTASLSVVAPDVMLQQPEPPKRLTREQKAIWNDIVEKVRPGWFYSSEILLELYVTTVSHQRQLESFLRDAEPGSSRHFELIRMHRTVALAAGALALKLRLTVRSTVDRYAPKIVSSTPGKEPWEDDALDGDEPPAA